MSDRISDAELDAVIDDAARSLTASPAPADLRAGVLTRIQERESGSRRAAWLVPAAAALFLAAGIYVWTSTSRGSLPGGSQAGPYGGLGSAQIAGGSMSGATPNAAADLRADSAPVLDPAAPTPVAAVPGGSRDLSNDGRALGSSLPPGFESIALDQETLPALTLDGLTPIDTLDVDSIPIESIRLDALGAN